MFELHDMKDLNKRLQDDLDTANEKLQCVTEDNTCLLAIIQDLRRELGAARTGSTTNGKDNLFSIAAGSTRKACVSDVIMVPNTMQLSVVAKGDATNEHISERMDADTDAGMDICEIPAMCYKTKWYIPGESVNEFGWIFPAETLRSNYFSLSVTQGHTIYLDNMKHMFMSVWVCVITCIPCATDHF